MLKSQGDSLFRQTEFVVLRQAGIDVNWNEEINKLEYIFQDPIKFDKKIDPNKLKFGSKISVEDGKEGVKREAYYTVKEIISPNLIKLSNDLIIKLIGVEPRLESARSAIQFLETKILKNQVYLKYDAIKYDKENHLLAYVFMKNKTFINAHMIKGSFCNLSTEFDFKYKDKFQLLLGKEQGHHDNTDKTHEQRD